MKLLQDAQHDFILSNGTIIKNVAELSYALKTADDSVYFHHVNDERNDFANWIENSVGDNILKNELLHVKNKEQMISLLDSKLFTVSAADQISEEMPPDIPPDISPEVPSDVLHGISSKSQKNMQKNTLSIPTDIISEDIKNNAEPKAVIHHTIEAETMDEHKQEKPTGKSEAEQKDEGQKTAAQAEAVVEIREITSKRLGYQKIDRLFKKGIPSICNMIFAGVMSTRKSETAMKIALNNKSSVYISLQDTEEKIINYFYSIDSKALDKINSGAITIKRLDTFEMARTQDIEPFRFVKDHSPDIVIVDSLSSLRLSFGDNIIGYRNFVNNIFKYFESLGIIAIFIKELDTDGDINKAFYENIIADIIVSFKKGRFEHMEVYKYFMTR